MKCVRPREVRAPRREVATDSNLGARGGRAESRRLFVRIAHVGSRPCKLFVVARLKRLYQARFEPGFDIPEYALLGFISEVRVFGLVEPREPLEKDERFLGRQLQMDFAI